MSGIIAIQDGMVNILSKKGAFTQYSFNEEVDQPRLEYFRLKSTIEQRIYRLHPGIDSNRQYSKAFMQFLNGVLEEPSEGGHSIDNRLSACNSRTNLNVQSEIINRGLARYLLDIHNALVSTQQRISCQVHRWGVLRRPAA
jgi:hypothetical protein